MQDVKFRKAGREMKKEAENNKSKISRLITALVQCGLLGFGGGNALIPVLYRKAVEEYHLVSKDDFEKAVVVASITPGALPVEIAAGIGRITGGDLGMLCAAAAISLPGCLLVLFFTALLSSFGSQLALQINYLSVGVIAYILYVLGCYVAQTLENSRADRIQSHWEKGKPSGRVSFSPSCVLIIAAVFLVTSGLILYSDFYSNLVPVANAVPGSILCKILTGTGYFLGYRSDGNIVTGLLTGLCGFGCAVAMSCITYSVGAYFYEQLENAAIFSQLKKSTRPIISGLLFTVGLGLIYNCIQIGTDAGIPSWFPALLCLLCVAGEILFVRKFRYRPLLMVLISAIMTLVFCNLAALF